MRTCLSLVIGKEAVGLLALTVAFFGCRYVASSSAPAPIAFKGVPEFREFAARNGIYSHSGNANGNIKDNFFVADHPLTLADFDDLQTLRNPGLTPAWRGILWVCEMDGSLTTIFPDQFGGKSRVWGNIIVVGDEDVMD